MRNISFWSSIILIAGLMAPTQSAKAEETGEEFYRGCDMMMKLINDTAPEDPDAMMDAMECLGYVAGASDMVSSYQKMLRIAGGKQVICLPEELSYREVITRVHRYMRSHPETMRMPRAGAFHEALKASYRCS